MYFPPLWNKAATLRLLLIPQKYRLNGAFYTTNQAYLIIGLVQGYLC